MSGLRFPDQESDRVRAFRAERELRLKESRQVGTWCICPQCGFKCPEQERRDKGYTQCPQCGSNQTLVASLPYNTVDANGVPIRSNPPPTAAEIAQLDRQQIPGGAR